MIPDPTAVFFGCVERWRNVQVNRSDGGAVDGSCVEELPLSKSRNCQTSATDWLGHIQGGPPTSYKWS